MNLTISEDILREAELLRRLFTQRAQMSQSAFGDRFSVGSGSMVWQYLSGHRPLSLKAGSRFAHGLGVPLSDFSPRLHEELREILDMTSPVSLPGDVRHDYVQIPCVELELKFGSKKYTFTPILPVASFIAFRRDWLDHHSYKAEKLLAIECLDDAMESTIYRKDLVVIDTEDVVLEERAVYAVNYEGTCQLRRTFRDAGVWWLHCDQSDSKHFPRKQLLEKQCLLIGRVVHRQSERI